MNGRTLSHVIFFVAKKIEIVIIVVFTDVRSQKVCHHTDIWGNWIGKLHTNGYL